MELIEGYKGKTTVSELLNMDIGTIDYMYYNLYLKAQTEQGRKELQGSAIEDTLDL